MFIWCICFHIYASLFKSVDYVVCQFLIVQNDHPQVSGRILMNYIYPLILYMICLWLDANDYSKNGNGEAVRFFNEF